MRYKYGGEGGIRTLHTVLPVYPLSRRIPLFLMANDSSIHIKMTHLFWKQPGRTGVRRQHEENQRVQVGGTFLETTSG